jgi:hypothetical protein
MFVKQLATRLGNPLMSEGETRKAISEAKAFLRNKSDSQSGGTEQVSAAPGGLTYQDYLNSRKKK